MRVDSTRRRAGQARTAEPAARRTSRHPPRAHRFGPAQRSLDSLRRRHPTVEPGFGDATGLVGPQARPRWHLRPQRRRPLSIAVARRAVARRAELLEPQATPVNFDGYDLDAAIHDEMFLPDGTSARTLPGAPRHPAPALRRRAEQHPGTGHPLVLERGHHVHGLRRRRGGRADHPDRLRAPDRLRSRVAAARSGPDPAHCRPQPIP